LVNESLEACDEMESQRSKEEGKSEILIDPDKTPRMDERLVKLKESCLQKVDIENQKTI
jgi:hypothetical protein